MIERMLALRSQGLSYEAMAERLNEEDTKPRTSERAGSEADGSAPRSAAFCGRMVARDASHKPCRLLAELPQAHPM